MAVVIAFDKTTTCCIPAVGWAAVWATLYTAPYAGQTVVLWFNVHDDGYPSDPTYSLFDDVSLTGN